MIARIRYIILCNFCMILFSNESLVVNVANEFHYKSKVESIVVYEENKPSISLQEGIVYIGEGLPRENKLRKVLCPFIGSEASSSVIEEIKKTVILHYKKSGFGLVAVSINEIKDMSEIEVEVIRAKLGEIRAQGAKYFNNERIKKEINIETGDYINTDEILSDIVFLNQNPFRNTTLYYVKGKNYGETDIVLETQDKFPVRVYGGYDFTGYNIVGQSRYFVGADLGTLYFVDHELSYQYLFYPSAYRWQGHSASYTAPFYGNTKFKLFGYYIESEPDIAPFGTSNGRSWMIAGKYSIPLMYKKFRSEFVISYEFKRTNNFYDFTTTLSEINLLDISQFLLGYEGECIDRFGKTAFGIYGYYSPGNMTRYNKTKIYNSMREGAKDHYVYSYARFDRVTYFPKKWSWILNFKGQISSGKLVPSEEMSIGGALTVRGYDENTLIGDEGLYVKNELRTPPVYFIKRGDLRFLVFVDYGKIWEKDINKINPGHHLSSAGGGLRYSYDDNITLRFDYGGQIKTVRTKSGKNSRAHIGIVLSY